MAAGRIKGRPRRLSRHRARFFNDGKRLILIILLLLEDYPSYLYVFYGVQTVIFKDATGTFKVIFNINHSENDSVDGPLKVLAVRARSLSHPVSKPLVSHNGSDSVHSKPPPMKRQRHCL